MAQVFLGARQFEFATWYEAIFKEALEHVVGAKNADLFEEYLSARAVGLGVVALDNLSGIIVLLKANKLRSAYMLSRSLIDYHIRLRYYVLQSLEPKNRWQQSNSRSIYNFLKQCKAYIDWQNAQEKTFSILKDRPLDLEHLQSRGRDKFLAQLERDHEVHSREFHHMLEVAEPEDEMRRFLRSTWLFQSGYMHGDQIMLAEVLEKADNEIVVHWDSKGVSPIHTLGEAIFYCQQILESVKLIKCWAFGLQVAWERSADVFIEPLERARRLMAEETQD